MKLFIELNQIFYLCIGRDHQFQSKFENILSEGVYIMTILAAFSLFCHRKVYKIMSRT